MMWTGSTIRVALLSSLASAIALCSAPVTNAQPESRSEGQGLEGGEQVLEQSGSALDADQELSSGQAAAPQISPSPAPETPIAQQESPVSPAPSTSTPAEAAPNPQGITIVSPQATTISDRSTNLVVQYPAGTNVQVLVNDQPIAADTPTQIQPDTAPGSVTQVWYNLPLEVGANVLKVISLTGAPPVSTTVTVQETATTLELVPKTDPRVPADGRSSVTLDGQILDEEGNPITRDALVTLSTSAGQFVGADQDRDIPGFQVLARDGRFTVELKSNLTAQKVRIRAAVHLNERREVEVVPKPIAPTQADNNGQSRVPVPAPDISPLQLTRSTAQLETYANVEFITNLRPFIISGTVNLRLGAGGTDFYGSFRDFLNPDRIDDDVRFDFTTSLFATGRIGEWLFTGAFNNTRPLNQTCDGTTRLFQDPQFCDQVYPVYGDSSTTDYLTPSLDSLFLKLERTSSIPNAGSDFFLWGDYSTPEFATASQLFTATNRQLHGFKGNFNLGNFQFTALYANNLQGFQRDTIAPNGTSGYYFLSKRLMIGGSEIVYLETEELARPGTVLERRQLSRSIDYEVDYDRGTLIFRRPILQTDLDPFGRSIVRRIVVTYQFESEGFGDTDLYAGRVQYFFSREPGKESWLAGSYLNEDQGGRTFEVYGLDLLVPLGSKGRLIAEFARSGNESIFRNKINGNAIRIEATGELFQGVLGRAYYRMVEENFSNNATFSFTPGQTRYGAELAAQVGKTTQLQFQFDREINFGIAAAAPLDVFNPEIEPLPGSRVDNSLTTFRAGVTQRFGAADLSLEYLNRTRRDRATDNLDDDSDQLVTRFNLPINKTLTFRAQNEINLGGGTDALYPDRTVLGLDWAVAPGITLRLAQQFIGETRQIKNNSITSLDAIMDHKLSEDTVITGRYSLLNGANGLTSQGAVGLNHRIILAPGLRMNLGYERIFGDIFAYTAAGRQFAQPYAVGQSSASIGVSEGDSYSVGLEYTDNPNFKASGRFEYRASDAGNSMVISAGAAGKLSPAVTVLARYQQANFANQRIGDRLGDTINAKFGLAYRNPADDKFNALLRYEFRQNPSTIPNDVTFENGTGSTAHLFALEMIYAPNYRWEFYGKVALRNTRSVFARDLVGTNTITLSQFRASYRIGYRWDVTGEVRWIHQPFEDYDEYGFVLEAGYYLTPNLRLSAGYSFGKALDNDFDRTKSGPFVNLSLKVNELFGGFGVQTPAPPQQQESLVKPVVSQPEGSQPSTVGTPTSAVPQPSAQTPAAPAAPTNPADPQTLPGGQTP